MITFWYKYVYENKEYISHLLLQLVVDIVDDHIIFHFQDFGDLLGDPWLQDIQLHLGHVHLNITFRISIIS